MGDAQTREEHVSLLAALSDEAPGPVRVRTLPFGYRVAKRGLDIVGAAVGLAVSAPVLAVLGMAIRMESKGPALYSQHRVGRGGNLFRIWKLRSMYVDSRERFPHLYDFTGLRNLDFYFHNDDDPRVTVLGRWVRRTSLDEFPNLWSVLRGDMSLVGPRPEIPDVMRVYGWRAAPYLSVKPGVTCLSGIKDRDAQTKESRIDQDLEYVEQMNLLLDLKIIWCTVGVIFLGRGVKT